MIYDTLSWSCLRMPKGYHVTWLCVKTDIIHVFLHKNTSPKFVHLKNMWCPCQHVITCYLEWWAWCFFRSTQRLHRLWGGKKHIGNDKIKNRRNIEDLAVTMKSIFTVNLLIKYVVPNQPIARQQFSMFKCLINSHPLQPRCAAEHLWIHNTTIKQKGSRRPHL